MSAELNEQQAEEAAKFLQAIAHPKRLLLLAALSDRQLSAGRLAAAVGLPAGMVYKHLHKLVEIGMLSVSVKAAGMRFSIASPETVLKLVKIQAALAAQIAANIS
ncbi:winged helix-turn-helix domain-containing protein (plasmid) [Ensifer adhaerens]|uniref:ArsR/SmtB family transcription factor n=1 Tax=Ensifer adhaerens TaxID=106592 RepID=UPI001CBD8903|nr:winged helix-turn-helix domain-containing protein [Ensifer adhaerens]MBZ7927588.1 winged helix-turn-helix domain-containing protein [Ensifer adhaerens]UAX97995.1 winged helix-turn-helix domain-containing protein [Ensifer adhaerens]UAY05375.1 winged helix-turn-helix domain-containing protein [Ensifer adhaerens]UAY12753.1 winged helix-turn-helix domain-containing protein [Ensifer adhaerens]